MVQTPIEAPNLTIGAARASFERHLKAANKAPRTIQGYLEAVDPAGSLLACHGRGEDIPERRDQAILRV